MAATDKIPTRTVTPPIYPAFRERLPVTNETPHVKSLSPGYAQKNRIVHLENDGPQKDEVAKTTDSGIQAENDSEVEEAANGTVDETEQKNEGFEAADAEAAAINEIESDLTQLKNPKTNSSKQMDLLYDIDKRIPNIVDPRKRQTVLNQFYNIVQGVISRDLAQYKNSLKTGPDFLGDAFPLIDLCLLFNTLADTKNLIVDVNIISTLRANVQSQLSPMLKHVVQSHLHRATHSDGEFAAFFETFQAATNFIKTIEEKGPNSGLQAQMLLPLRTMIQNLPQERQVALVQSIGASLGASVWALHSQQISPSDENRVRESIADQWAQFALVIEAQTSDRLPTNLKQASIHFRVNALLVAFTDTLPHQNNPDEYDYRFQGFLKGTKDHPKGTVSQLFSIVEGLYVAEFVRPMNHEARIALAKQFNGALDFHIASLRRTFPTIDGAFLKQAVAKLKKEMREKLMHELGDLLKAPDMTGDKKIDAQLQKNYEKQFKDYTEAINTINDAPQGGPVAAGGDQGNHPDPSSN
jgi:hypothetical protein